MFPTGAQALSVQGEVRIWKTAEHEAPSPFLRTLCDLGPVSRTFWAPAPPLPEQIICLLRPLGSLVRGSILAFRPFPHPNIPLRVIYVSCPPGGLHPGVAGGSSGGTDQSVQASRWSAGHSKGEEEAG